VKFRWDTRIAQTVFTGSSGSTWFRKEGRDNVDMVHVQTCWWTLIILKEDVYLQNWVWELQPIAFGQPVSFLLSQIFINLIFICFYYWRQYLRTQWPFIEGLLAQIHVDMSSQFSGRNRTRDLRKTQILLGAALLSTDLVTNDSLHIHQDPLLHIHIYTQNWVRFQELLESNSNCSKIWPWPYWLQWFATRKFWKLQEL